MPTRSAVEPGFRPGLTMPLTLPRALFGTGMISALSDELGVLGLSRPMLVTDKGVVAAGLSAKVLDACGRGVNVTLFDAVTENPLFADVDAGAGQYARYGCDCVIALGGGSVIDAAKLIALLATNPGSASDYVGVPNVRHTASAPLIAIPTTAGTGSEASHSAGIHPDAQTVTLGMSSRHLIPKIAILDPDLVASLPRRLVAATGIDALSHCIEGYLSKKDQPLGKPIALDGIARAARSLRRAFADREDEAARGEMMIAAFAGGVSIGMGLGPAHAIALTCSDQGFHHGILSGIGLVASLDATAERVPDLIGEVADAFGVPRSASLGNAIATLMRELGLPATLGELGYRMVDLQLLGQSAHRSHFNLFAPFHPTAADYAEMISKSANGTRS